MTKKRTRTHHGAPQRAHREQDEQRQLDQRRESMQAAEGHAGSIPRGNQQPEEDDTLGHRQHEYERLLGH